MCSYPYICASATLSFEQDLNQLRELSLGITDHAIYRLQIQLSASQVFFSYLPVEVELLDVVPSEYDAKRRLDADKTPFVVRVLTDEEDTTAEPNQKRIKTEESDSGNVTSEIV
jgi:hypothetical protein